MTDFSECVSLSSSQSHATDALIAFGGEEIRVDYPETGSRRNSNSARQFAGLREFEGGFDGHRLKANRDP